MVKKMDERQVCEAQMMWLLDKLIEVYHEYNPSGKYLAIGWNNDDGDDYRHINNRDWEGGEDEQRPIDCSMWKGKEKFYEFNAKTVETD